MTLKQHLVIIMLKFTIVNRSVCTKSIRMWVCFKFHAVFMFEFVVFFRCHDFAVIVVVASSCNSFISQEKIIYLSIVYTVL